MYRERKIIRIIKKMRYPYLQSLSCLDVKSRMCYLTQINELAKAAFTKNDDEFPTMPYEDLCCIVDKDPSAWLVESRKNELIGFIHVQMISQEQAKMLQSGKIDENNLNPLVIASARKTVIHIGSIVSKNYPLPITDKTIFKLIAGVVDKILSLREKYPSVNELIYCNYEDKFGDRHFIDILPRYGFKKVGISINGDSIYNLDLEKQFRLFSEILNEVSRQRSLYFMKHEKKRASKITVNSFHDFLTKINDILEGILKVKKQLCEMLKNSNN